MLSADCCPSSLPIFRSKERNLRCGCVACRRRWLDGRGGPPLTPEPAPPNFRCLLPTIPPKDQPWQRPVINSDFRLSQEKEGLTARRSLLYNISESSSYGRAWTHYCRDQIPKRSDTGGVGASSGCFIRLGESMGTWIQSSRPGAGCPHQGDSRVASRSLTSSQGSACEW